MKITLRTARTSKLNRRNRATGRRSALATSIASLAASLLLASSGHVFAASATWNAAPTNGNWVATGAENNWSTGAATFPGSTAITTSADVATFGASATTAIVINSATLNIGSITFNAAAAAYTVGVVAGNSLLLSSGGTIQSVAANTETINAPLVIQGAGGTYTISADGVAAANTLLIGGGITGTGGGATTLTLNGANTGANAVTGVIANGGATTLALNKQGAGNWNLTNVNTYTGATNITAGTLTVNGSIAAGSAVTVNGATAVLAGTGAVFGNVTLTGNGSINLTGAGNIAGNVTVNGAGGTWAGAGSVGGATGVTVTAGNFAIGNGAILTLTNPAAALNVTGAATISAGNAASQLTGSLNYTSAAASNFQGVIAGAASTVTLNNAAAALTLSGTNANTFGGAANVTAGTLILAKTAGVNAISGTTLNIGSVPGAANTAVGVVQLNAANQIADTTNVIINGDGRLNRNGNNETIGSGASGLAITNGSVTGAGILTVAGAGLNMNGGSITGGATNLTADVTATSNAVTNAATINDAVTLAGAGVRTFTVNVGTAVVPAPDLNITGIISGAAANGLTKTGAGTMQIGIANTYNGQTIVNNGILAITGSGGVPSTALGVANAVANDTLVNGTGTLLLLNGAHTGAEQITLNGVGFTPAGAPGPLGALAVVAGGTGTVGGPITIALNNTVITAGNGSTLNLNGGVIKNGVNVIFGNAAVGATTATSGIININGPISGTSGVGTFNSDVLYTAGVTNLNASNPYLGATWLNNGAVVNANVAGALPSPAVDGGSAAQRTALIMDADTLVNFPLASYPTAPAGAIGGTGGSTINFGANQAVQFIASGPGSAGTSTINLNGFALTVGTTFPATPGSVSPVTFTGVITGTNPAFALTKDGTNTQILTGINTYIGFTAVNGGFLQVGNGLAAGPASQLGTGLVFVNPGGTLDIDLKNGGTFNNTVNTAVGSTVRGINGNLNANSKGAANDVQTIAGQINGGGNFIQNGGGTSIFANINGYTGGTRITGANSNVTIGTLAAGATAGQNVAANTVLVDTGGTFQLVNVSGGVLNNNIDNATAAAQTGTVLSTSTFTTTLTGALTNTGVGATLALTQNGSGTTILVNAGNTYTGATRVLAGTLQVGTAALVGSVGNQGPAPAPTNIVVATGGTLAIVNTTGNAIANNITNGVGGAGTVNVNSANTNTLSGTLTNGGAGTLALTQSGAGTTILSNIGNTYTGATTISGGTLQVGTAALGGSVGPTNPINLGTGGTLSIVNIGGPVANTLANNIQNNLGGTGLVFVNSANNNILNGNISDGAGSLAVTVANTGAAITTTVNGLNNYTGVTNVNSGTLVLGSGTALGSTAGGTVVANGATLNLNNQAVGNEALQIQGVGQGAALGALVNNGGGASSLGGPVTLAGATTIGTPTAATSITLNGAVSGAAALTKIGAGTLTLNGPNSYTGVTNITAGIVQAGDPSALGTVGANTIVTGGAALQLLNGVNVGAEPLTINGAGVGAAAPGALTQTAGSSSSFAGLITLASNSTISTNGAGTMILSGGINKTGLNLTVTGGGTVTSTGAITGNTGVLNSDLIVNGATMNLNFANNYLGQTFITSIVAGDGIVNANVANALPTSPVRTQVIMDGAAAGVPALAGAGASVLNLATNQAIASLTGIGGGATASIVNLGANTLTIGFGTVNVTPGYVNSTFAGNINGTGGLTKDETSTQTLSGANTFTGPVAVNGGTLSLAGGAAIANTVAVTVTNPGILNLVNSETIGTLAGNGSVTLNAQTLTTGLNGLGTTFSGVISGAGGSLIKQGTDTFIVSGPNTYTGTTTVNAGTLQAGVATVPGVSGAFGVNSQTAVFSATLELAGFSNTLGNLSGGGANSFVQNTLNGPATLTLAGVGGPVTYGGVIQDTVATPLTLIKNGAGTQNLSGANTFTGPTTVNAGILGLSGGAALADTNQVTVTNPGTLNIITSEKIGTLSGSGFVTLNNQTLTVGDNTNNTIYSGLMSGVGGSLIKTGTDTFQIISGNSTYTGGTQLNQGTLLIDASSNPTVGAVVNGPVGTGTLTIAGGTTLGTTANGTTVANAVTVNGNFTIINSGAGQDFTLTGPINLANGIRTITGGTNGGQIHLSGVISSPTASLGGVTYTTAGLVGANPFVAFLLDGAAANTYTGLTTVNANAILGFASLAATNKVAGNIQIDGTGVVEYLLVGGVKAHDQIADTATVTVNSPGTTITGGVFQGFDLRGGTETIATLNGSAAGTVGLGNGTLTVSSGTFAGTIGDGVFPGAGVGGSLVKNGAGTLLLTGANTYGGTAVLNQGGTTTLNAGILAVGNTKALGNANLTVTGGTLQNSTLGTTNKPLLMNIGAGNIQITGGTVALIVGGKDGAPLLHDQITTTGSLTKAIAGKLALTQTNGYLLASGDQATLLTTRANGVFGGTALGTPVPAANVTGLAQFSNTPLLIPTVNAYLSTVVLEAMQGSFSNLNGSILPDGSVLTLTPNQQSVAGALDQVALENNFKTGTATPGQVALKFINDQTINGSVASVPGDLDLLAPEELTSIFHIGRALSGLQYANLMRHFDELRAEAGSAARGGMAGLNSVNVSGMEGPRGRGGKEVRPPRQMMGNERWGTFLMGSGNFTHVGSTSNASGYNIDTGGVTVGLEYKVAENFVVGIDAGYASTSARLINGGKVDVDGGQFGIFASYFDMGFYVDAAVHGGVASYKTRRTALGGVETASPGGSSISVLLAGGYDWKSGGWTVGPTVNFQYTNTRLNGFTENGGSLAPLTVAGHNGESVRTSVGARAFYDANLSNGIIIRPEARVAWQHEYSNTSYALTSNFATLGGNAFTVSGPQIGRDSLLIGAGVTVVWNSLLSTFVAYDGELARTNTESHSVSGGVRIKF